MNEHIKQLAEQAGLVRNGDIGMKRWEGPRSDSINDQDLEKFAELIVAECACLSYFDDSGNPEVEEALEFWRKNMLKHFGVKE